MADSYDFLVVGASPCQRRQAASFDNPEDAWNCEGGSGKYLAVHTRRLAFHIDALTMHLLQHCPPKATILHVTRCLGLPLQVESTARSQLFHRACSSC